MPSKTNYHGFPTLCLVTGSGLAFSSSLEYMFKNKGTNVAVWAHGHTHYNDDKIIGTHTISNSTLIIRPPDNTPHTEGTRVVSNMVGYKHGKQRDYRPDLVITVAK